MYYYYYGINEKLDRRLKAEAKKFKTADEFIADQGWDDYMNDILDQAGIPSEDGEELNETQINTIDAYLTKVWEEAQEEKKEAEAYREAHSKANYRHFHLKVPNHMTEVIEMLESQPNKNGYIIDLIEKDIDEKRVLMDIVGAPRRGNGKMRNERFLQNYTASQFRMALSGKGDFQQYQREKGWWRSLFNNAIDDLKDGGVINGKGMKNNISYWEEQISKLEEFEPR